MYVRTLELRLYEQVGGQAGSYNEIVRVMGVQLFI